MGAGKLHIRAGKLGSMSHPKQAVTQPVEYADGWGSVPFALLRQFTALSELRVYVVLAGFQGSNGKCWPSIEVISQHVGVCPRAVSTHLKSLVEKGLISKHGRRGKKQRNEYVVLNQPIGKQSDRKVRSPSPSDQEGSEPGGDRKVRSRGDRKVRSPSSLQDHLQYHKNNNTVDDVLAVKHEASPSLPASEPKANSEPCVLDQATEQAWGEDGDIEPVDTEPTRAQRMAENMRERETNRAMEEAEPSPQGVPSMFELHRWHHFIADEDVLTAFPVWLLGVKRRFSEVDVVKALDDVHQRMSRREVIRKPLAYAEKELAAATSKTRTDWSL